MDIFIALLTFSIYSYHSWKPWHHTIWHRAGPHFRTGKVTQQAAVFTIKYAIRSTVVVDLFCHVLSITLVLPQSGHIGDFLFINPPQSLKRHNGKLGGIFHQSSLNN